MSFDKAIVECAFATLLRCNNANPVEFFDFKDEIPLLKSQTIAHFINSIDAAEKGAFIFRVFEVIYGVINHMDRSKIVHFKINCDTIRIFNDRIFLSDFEYACYSPTGVITIDDDIDYIYINPEALETKQYGAFSEVWTLCIYLWELATGKKYRTFLQRFLKDKTKPPNIKELSVIYSKRNVCDYMIRVLPEGYDFKRFGERIRTIFANKTMKLHMFSQLTVDPSLPNIDSVRSTSTVSTMSISTRSSVSMTDYIDSDEIIENAKLENTKLKNKWRNVIFNKCHATFDELPQGLCDIIGYAIDDCVDTHSASTSLGERIFATCAILLRICGYVFSLEDIGKLGSRVYEDFDFSKYNVELNEIASTNSVGRFI